MKMYKYEMHCHTSETSACGHIGGAELAEYYKSAGFDGVVITDHFFNGNTTVPRILPWKQKVELFQRGYRAAKKRGDEIGIDVFWGWEVSLEGTDFLTYGLDEKWLLAHKDCDKMKMSKYCESVRKSGGFIVQAHPFREADYIEFIRLLPRHVDAVETINACRTDFENKMADQYADNYGLIKFCGGDNHRGDLPRLAVLELDFRAKNTTEILQAVMRNEHKIGLYETENDGDKVKLKKIY